MKSLMFRSFVVVIGLSLFWQAIIYYFHLPTFILPSLGHVIKTEYSEWHLIIHHLFPTLLEMSVGLLLGIFLGSFFAIALMFFKTLRHWFLPLMIISQAIPTFAIAPLLVLWFGYGIASKVIITTLMLFFPVMNSFYDGLSRTETDWLDLASVMGGSRWRTLWLIRVPSALPALAMGIRIATTMAPMGAIVGEWIGSSEGLGFLMLNANARMQIDIMFACVLTLIFIALLLYFSVDYLLKRWVRFS